ncbi:MAG TPA: dTDP-4-dehydrorhamnose reductase [Thermoanaerobaculia bacterium]|nr:dTDP-4-dehydrorhamnose reductase [Thermoanaerobaculia bacterium]
MHRWLITGAGGMVGIDLRDALQSRADAVIPVTKSELDITDGDAVRELVYAKQPTIIVNCAAYTRVDDAEAHEAAANAVNGAGVESLAQAANDINALLVQISTDFVFDGSQRTPYEENAPTNPLSAYGRSKLLGEQAAARADRHLIIRTAWLFGVHGPNFVEEMRNQVKKGTNPLRVVNDQRGRPTYTPHLATAIVRLSLLAAESEHARGIVHYADEPEVTWFGFACAIVASLGERTFDQIAVEPVTSAEFPRPAKRPAYSVLSTERYMRLTGAEPESWREGLQEYLTLRT